VLTREVLCVVDSDDDIQLRTFTVADIDCQRQTDGDAAADPDVADALVVVVTSRRHSTSLVSFVYMMRFYRVCALLKRSQSSYWLLKRSQSSYWLLKRSQSSY
jgi:hypothetical protein